MKKKTETKKLIYIPALIALLVLSILLSASIGQVEIPLLDTFKILMDRLFHVKLEAMTRFHPLISMSYG